MRKLLLCVSVLAMLLLAIVPLQAQSVANVRLAHFSPDAPAVDVYVDGEAVAEGLEYPSVTGFLEMDAGSYEVAIVEAGTSLESALLTQDVTVEAAAFTTVAAVGSMADDTLTATVFTEDIGDIASDEASLTVVHAMGDAPGVDVYGSNILLIQSLRFPSATGDGAFTRTVPPGTYDFDVNIAENRAAILIEVDDIRLEAGTAYLLAVLGTETNTEVTIVTPDEIILTPVEEEE